MKFPCHTIEFMNWFRHPMAVQIMKMHVPEFQACRCQGRGMRTMKKPRKAKMGKRGYVGSEKVMASTRGKVG